MSHYFRKSLAGFTLLELIVSITIVSIILTVIVFNQSTYSDGVALTNLADNISLTISQAQAYGIGVRELSPGSSDFSSAYGLTFSLLDTGSNKAYIYFADRNTNNIYDGNWTCPTGGAGDECLEKFDIGHGDYIDSICAVRSSGGDLCTAKRADVNFTRPNTQASIILFDNGGQVLNPADTIGVRIMLKSPNGIIRSVLVYKTGQISVE